MSEPVIHHLTNLERNQNGILWTMSFLGFYLECLWILLLNLNIEEKLQSFQVLGSLFGFLRMSGFFG
uniref:Uncharacterized protein n=1 Tax=Meloidogyne enterolobii TaxID=390850 RepID=A0A6V7TSD4_MELEN|nr:unnamed protein product [Meloidogyne enterolobii]